MAKYGPGEVDLFLIGGFNILSELSTISSKVNGLLEMTRPFGESWNRDDAVGIRFMELSAGGWYDDRTGGFNEAVVGLQNSIRASVFGVEGNVIGEEFVGAFGTIAGEYNRGTEREALHKADSVFRVTGAVDDHCRILHALGAETAASGNTEASSVDAGDVGQSDEPTIPITDSTVADEINTSPAGLPHGVAVGDVIVIAGHTGSTPDINGEQTVATIVDADTFTISTDITVAGTGGTYTVASRAFGGAGHLQVTDVTLGGYTDITFGIDDSPDDAVFTSLLTFTNVTARTAERVTAAGRVDRYLASNWLFNGAGSGQSVTFLIGFHRNRS